MREFGRSSVQALVSEFLTERNSNLLAGVQPPVDPIRNACTPLTDKRPMLERIWEAMGPAALLEIGQGIRKASYDPVWVNALETEHPAILFDKWLRFQEYAHWRNRSRIASTGGTQVVFTRYTLDGDTPLPAENLLMCGIVVTILEEIGCQGVKCEMPLADGGMFAVRESQRNALPEEVDRLDTNQWSIAWQKIHRRPEVPLCDDRMPHVPMPPSVKKTLHQPIKTLVSHLMRDVSRPWKVEELAGEAGMSSRSLQRRLKEADLSFSSIVRLARIHESCRLLRQQDVSMTTIAYCAGFSDSAHFSRDFRQSMGLSPTRYREIFHSD